MKKKYCKYCGEDIDSAPNTEEVVRLLEKVGGREMGKYIHLGIKDREFTAGELCNICYTLMKNYRAIQEAEA